MRITVKSPSTPDVGLHGEPIQPYPWLTAEGGKIEPTRCALPDGEYVLIAYPLVRPLQTRLDKPEYVQEVWDAFVKPEQDAEIPPSVEMRMLMAILRAVYEGFDATNVTDTMTAVPWGRPTAEGEDTP